MNFEKTPSPIIENPKQKPSLGEALSRREVVGGLGIASIFGGLATAEHLMGDKKDTEVTKEEGLKFEREYSPRFADEMSGYKELYSTLKFDEIMFVDDQGRPLGKPIKIVDFNGVSPGSRDQHGIIKGDINQHWLDTVRKHVCVTEGIPYDEARDRPRQFNLLYIAREMVSTLADEGLTVDGLAVQTYLDIVKAMSAREVKGGGGLSRLEYLRINGMKGADALPTQVREEITFVLPGLAAQESKYVNDVVSITGARGIMQFMPQSFSQVQKELKKEGNPAVDNILEFTDQVTAARKLLEMKYAYIQDHADQELAKIQQEFFGGDAMQFERYFLAPVVINSYNSGEGRVVKCIKLFLKTYPDLPTLKKAIGEYPDGFGLDAYLLMTKICSVVVGRSEKGNPLYKVSGYGRDSSQYVVRAYTLAQILAEEQDDLF